MKNLILLILMIFSFSASAVLLPDTPDKRTSGDKTAVMPVDIGEGCEDCQKHVISGGANKADKELEAWHKRKIWGADSEAGRAGAVKE